MIGFVRLPGAGRLTPIDATSRIAHHRSSCRRLARYPGMDVVEVTVVGSTACLIHCTDRLTDGFSFPVRWCPECGISALRQDWRRWAACVGSKVDFFTFDPTEQAAARAICRRCPVASECFEYSESIDAPIGVWGGARRAA
jgi:hypothetical protein